MKNLGAAARNISLLSLILLTAWGCSHKQDDPNLNDENAVDNAAEFSGLQLILVRHAEAYRNLPDRESVPESQLDTLTPRGIQQAEAVGNALKENETQVAAVLTAPTGRASQTAALVMETIGLEGEPVIDPAVDACQPDETDADQSARIMGAIASLQQEHEGETVVIVTHQHLIRCAIDRAAEDDKDGADEVYECPPGSMAILHISEDGWTIQQKPEMVGP